MYRYFSVFLVLGGLTTASGALAQAPSPEDLQILVDEAKGFIPPEYQDALAAAQSGDGMEMAFPSPVERADCRFGVRSGNQIATSLMRGLKPSCDRLLAPIGTEWIPPAQPEASSAFGRCFDVAFSRQVTSIVFDTAQLCAWQGFEASLTAAQVEYNRCYLAVASDAANASFVLTPFAPGTFAMIPRDTERWQNLLAGIRSRYGQQTGYLTMACEVGKSDAESGVPPQNLLQRQ